MQTSVARQRQAADIARLERELAQVREIQCTTSDTLSSQLEHCTEQLQEHGRELSGLHEEQISAQASKVKLEAASSLAQADVRLILPSLA
jgi:GTP cyclohydrolase II